MAVLDRRVAASIALAAALTAVAGAEAKAVHPDPRPSSGAGGGTSDDVPPFVHARGGEDGPLELTLSGLTKGYARVASGERIFGLCWRGGAGPYAVTLRDASLRVILHETAIPSEQLIKSSRPVVLARGVYSVDVADSAGLQVEGRFEVVEPSALPAQPALEVATIDKGDPVYSFETYLRVLPDLVSSHREAADQMAALLCHRS